MRWYLVILLIPILLATSANAATEAMFTVDEDSTFRSESTINEIMGLKNDTTVVLSSTCEDVSVELEDSFITITATNNFNGECWVSFGYVQDGVGTDGALLVNVTPNNDAPIINDIELSGDPAEMMNPVVVILNYTDIDGDIMDITWYLDGEEIGKDPTFQRYIYPDQHNLSVIIDDGNGGTDSKTVTIHTIPPEGWGEDPDNTKNRFIFWMIFGSAGLILLAAMVWVLFKPEKIENKKETTTSGE